MEAQHAVRWIRLSAQRVEERRSWLTDLDAAIGDGDHGINLARGFTVLVDRLDAGELPIDSGPALVTAAGQAITGTVGGASGALYGQALVRAGSRLAARPGVDAVDDAARLADALETAVAAIMRLGRSRPGEKTMLDALAPAARALRREADAGVSAAAAAHAAADAAEAGAAATVPLLATKGRASYLGARSIGHLDPGAASSAVLLRALADILAGT